MTKAASAAGAWTLHVSTDYVFDGDKREPYLESDPVGPRSGYGRSKLVGERAVAGNTPDRHTIVRTSWLFGAGGRCFPQNILELAADRDQLTVVEDQVGSHPAADARSLDLDDDLFAAVQAGVVHLGDRRRGERLLVEVGE